MDCYSFKCCGKGYLRRPDQQVKVASIALE
jgi:hypothetical protein